jgi:hypothetical protein
MHSASISVYQVVFPIKPFLPLDFGTDHFRLSLVLGCMELEEGVCRLLCTLVLELGGIGVGSQLRRGHDSTRSTLDLFISLAQACREGERTNRWDCDIFYTGIRSYIGGYGDSIWLTMPKTRWSSLRLIFATHQAVGRGELSGR